MNEMGEASRIDDWPCFFQDPSDCCGCGACAVKCPVDAISMEERSGGFLYPTVNKDRCIKCGLCERVCGFKNVRPRKTNGPSWAACADCGLDESASGGVSAVIALACIEAGGVVFGCACEDSSEGIVVKHRKIETIDELSSIKGSKYVQSDTSDVFAKVKESLDEGREVVFFGTPCQVAGLFGYLGNSYSKLLTVDLVCHGVPSLRMFRDYSKSVLERGRRLVDVTFRSKRDGWKSSMLMGVRFDDGSEDFIEARRSSYYAFFLSLLTLRDSCYRCPFANTARVADVTLGDCWGIEDVRPDLITADVFDLNRGVSCVIANTDKGASAIDVISRRLKMCNMNLSDIVAGNEQLQHPSKMPVERQELLSLYDSHGWGALEARWHRRRLAELVRNLLYGFKRRIG